MRYFTDEHVEGIDNFMCARGDENGVEVRMVHTVLSWVPSDMTLSMLESLVKDGTIREIDGDPFKECDCQHDN